MLRVLHVIGPLSTGGAQTQLLGLIREAHSVHWEASVVGTSEGALSAEFESLDCPVTILRRLGSPGLGRMWRLRRVVRRGRFDVIHGNLWQSNLYCRIAVLGMRNRPAVVISERNVEAGRSRIKRLLDAGLASVTDAYVGNTEAVGRFIKDIHPVSDQDVIVIPNAIDRAVFHPPVQPENQTPVRVGSVGRLDPEKGFNVLVEAVRLVHDTLPVEVHVVGEGPERPRLEHLAAGLPISFIGALSPGAEVADFLRNLDVFVLPSTFREGRPNVILEAVAVGLPVVATDIDGMSEVFRGPHLVPPDDAAALANAISTAAVDPDRWKVESDPVPVEGFNSLAERYVEVFRKAASRAGVGKSQRRPA